MINSFLKFEKKYDLFDIKLDGVSFWHLIRVSIYNDIMKQRYNIPDPHQSKVSNNRLRYVIYKLKQSMNYLKNNPYKKIKKKDILILNHHRRVRDIDNNCYICLYTSNLIHHLNDNYYVYENHYQQKHFTPVPEKHIKYTDIIGNKWLVNRVLAKIFNKKLLSSKEKKIIIKLINDINSDFSVQLDQKKWIHTIENILFSYHGFYKTYRKIIEKIQPKVIIQVVSYEITRYVINKIAKELEIPTIELQHGTMGKYHIAYNFSEKMTIDTFPDFIFTFGDYWKDNTRLPIDDNKVISVGWPFYEKQVKRQQNIQNNKTIILFISQGTIGKKLSKMAIEIKENINLNEYHIIYKLHPGEYDVWKKNYPWLINSEIEVIDHNNYDMHYYFNQADIQIGVNSTAIFEGLGYDLQTFIIKLYGYEYMEDLYKNGYVTLVKNSTELLNMIEEKQIIKEKIDSNYFWEPDSMNKMITEINNIAGTDFRKQRDTDSNKTKKRN